MSLTALFANLFACVPFVRRAAQICKPPGQRQKILSLSKYCTVLTSKHHFTTLKNFRDMSCENICYRKIKIPLFGLVAPNDGIFTISDFIVIIPQNGKKIKTGMLGGGAVY